MPLTLVHRAGGDTLGKLEAAAARRFREAEKLFQQGERLGAVYLFGYSIEIRLKAAYYRTIGLVPGSAIQPHRRPAEDAIRALPFFPSNAQPGHHLRGWAGLLAQTRAGTPNPLDATVASEMHQHVDAAFKCWVEYLRYRANQPYNAEVTAVRTAARWFRTNATRLWS